MSKFPVVLIAACVIGASVQAPARAQTFPSQPIKLIVPFAPGGGVDIVGRTLAENAARQSGFTVVVENRTGAGGNVGSTSVAKAAPDGYTLLVASNSNSYNNFLYSNMQYDAARDLQAVVQIGRVPMVLLVSPHIPPRNVAEVVALAKAKPGAMSYASSGVGAGPHLTSSLFLAEAGIDINHVPYRGDADALVDLLAGRVQTGFMSIAPTFPHIQSGALRALAVSSAERSPLLPNLPTVAESGYPGFDMGAWWGLVAPAGTPEAIVKQLAEAVRPILDSKAFADQFASQGIVAGKLGPDAFAKKIADDVKRLAEVVKRAGIKPE